MRALAAAILLLTAPLVARAQATVSGNAPAVPARAPDRVLVSGTVPDEATKSAVLRRMESIYGADRVSDQLTVGNVIAPPNWSGYVQKLLDPRLKQVSHGELQINGNTIELKGEIANESQRQQLVSDMAGVLSPSYTIKNGLHVAESKQSLLDETLADRTVEFESSKATLTPAGTAVLDQMAAALQQLNGQTVMLIGHTSDDGPPVFNIAISKTRAEVARAYLISKGVNGNSLIARGVGPAQPIASNQTLEGRARNRRIEFRVIAAPAPASRK